MALTLNKQTVNLVIDQGTTFEKVITAKNTSGGNVTISSGTCTAKLRPSHYTSNNVVSYTQSDGTTVERLCEGVITVSPSATY